MKQNVKIRSGGWFFTALLCSSLVACDWVDSTGTQTAVSRTDVFLDDTPIGTANAINEKSLVPVVIDRNAIDGDGKTYRWSDAPIEEGALTSCAAIPGFDITIAASTLANACTDATTCSVGFEPEEDAQSEADFTFEAPELKASIGLKYALTITTESGSSSTRDYDFCLIAINEAPDANDDTFVIREGVPESFSVMGINLLTNDTDDIDVSNMPLTVNTTPLVEPSSAEFLELKSDGSFVYKSRLTNILSDQFDSFEYEVTDGIFTSTARVSLRIVASNQAPALIDDIPTLRATVGVVFVENLSLYFMDPEQGDLSFSFAPGFDLPANSGLSLQSNGVLSGIPSLADVGSYTLKLLTSDGGQEIETLMAFTISGVPANSRNSIPEYIEDSVADRTLFLGTSMVAITPEFSDDDDDELTYSLFGSAELPAGVTIDDETGVISGRPLARIWVRDLRVLATDPSGSSAISETFFIRVR